MKPIRYFCRKCGTEHTINKFWQWFFQPHIGASKWIKCKTCHKIRIMPRVDGLKFWDWPKERK